MANTFTQIHIQLVFAVKFREAVIHESWREELQMYMTGTLQSHEHKLLAIYAMPDHVHMMIGWRPTESMSDLVHHVKANATKWINERRFLKTRFEWQKGYGAFSYTKSDVPRVIRYVLNQPEHHKQMVFVDEYRRILTSLDIEFDERYIFKDLV